MASGLLKRNIRVATGVVASAAPASRPAAAPNRRRTVAYRRPTAATPMSASGTSRLQELTPKSRAAMSCTQSEAGGLSTVMALPESNDPKKNAFQLVEPACTAAE